MGEPEDDFQEDSEETGQLAFKQKKLTPEEQEALNKAMEDAIKNGGFV